MKYFRDPDLESFLRCIFDSFFTVRNLGGEPVGPPVLLGTSNGIAHFLPGGTPALDFRVRQALESPLPRRQIDRQGVFWPIWEVFGVAVMGRPGSGSGVRLRALKGP